MVCWAVMERKIKKRNFVAPQIKTCRRKCGPCFSTPQQMIRPELQGGSGSFDFKSNLVQLFAGKLFSLRFASPETSATNRHIDLFALLSSASSM